MFALLLAATSVTAVDAERAFARDAERIGQWTASRFYADPDAVMFTPQAIWARDFLRQEGPENSASLVGKRHLPFMRRSHRRQHRAVEKRRWPPTWLLHYGVAAGERPMALAF